MPTRPPERRCRMPGTSPGGGSTRCGRAWHRWVRGSCRSARARPRSVCWRTRAPSRPRRWPSGSARRSSRCSTPPAAGSPRPRGASASAAPPCGGVSRPTACSPTAVGAAAPPRPSEAARSAGAALPPALASPLRRAVGEVMPATPFAIEEYVRWSDVDAAGIIFYGSYVRFFEIAETELFRACGLAYSDFFDRYGIFLPRKVVHNEFYWPARLDDRLRVAAYVGRVGTSSMTLNFDVLRHGSPSLRAAGWKVLVCVGRGGLQPPPLPGELLPAVARPTPSPQAGRGALGTAVDSGVVTVSRARDRLTARARGSGPEVGGARRARVEADFEAVVIGGDTVSCRPIP